MDNSKKKLVMSAIFLVICLLLAFISYSFFGKKITENSIALLEARKSLSLSESRYQNQVQDEKLFNKISDDNVKINSLFISPDDPIKLIKFWEELASKCEVGVEITTTGVIASESDAWKSVGYKISAKGSVSNVLRFIEKLERSPYISEIQSVSLGAISANNLSDSAVNIASSGSLQLDLVIKVYSK
jgi:hypothetical protein